MSRLGVALAVARAEGARGLIERWHERREEARELARHRLRGVEEVLDRAAAAVVLNVLPAPLEARRGGVQQALAARLAAARGEVATALAELRDGRWWLRVDSPGAAPLRAPAAGERLVTDADRAEALAAILAALAHRLGRPPLWHLEQASGLDLERLTALARCAPMVLSTHDFALFCTRVDLLEAPHARDCGGSRDEARCHACRTAAGAVAPPPQAPRRRAAAELLSACRALIHPSDFARRRHAELFPEARPAREEILPPALTFLPCHPRTVASPPRHVAFVGQASVRKGLPDFIAAARSAAARSPNVRFSVLGGGDPGLLLDARRAGLRVHGYYRAPTLPRRLVEHSVDLAVLPSRFPETHCLALDACLAAGVPVLTSGMGALGERVAGAARIATNLLDWSLEQVLSGAVDAPTGAARISLPKTATAAHLEIYAQASPGTES